MTLNNFRSNILPPLPLFNYGASKLNQLQADLVFAVRTWAVDELGAAMAHQLNEPLTALLLYLHEIKQKGDHSNGREALPSAMQEIVDKALRETKRVCDIVERMGHAIGAPVDAETAVALGHEAIESWRRGINAKGNGHELAVQFRSGQHSLTPREREVLTLVTGGASNKEGGHRLGISTRTFETHRAHIMEKLGAKNAADLVRMALSDIR